jgi:hypothetical protein
LGRWLDPSVPASEVFRVMLKGSLNMSQVYPPPELQPSLI